MEEVVGQVVELLLLLALSLDLLLHILHQGHVLRIGFAWTLAPFAQLAPSPQRRRNPIRDSLKDTKAFRTYSTDHTQED